MYNNCWCRWIPHACPKHTILISKYVHTHILTLQQLAIGQQAGKAVDITKAFEKIARTPSSVRNQFKIKISATKTICIVYFLLKIQRFNIDAISWYSNRWCKNSKKLFFKKTWSFFPLHKTIHEHRNSEWIEEMTGHPDAFNGLRIFRYNT